MNRFQTWYQGLPRVLRALLTVNVVIYGLYLLVFQWYAPLEAAMLRFMALTPTGTGVLTAPWTVLTYAVTHLHLYSGGFWALLSFAFHMLFLYWIGEEMERMLGGTWLLVTYFVAALGGALGALAFTALTGAAAPYAGAMPAVLGVMMATAVRYPHREIGLFLIGVVRLMYVVIGFLVLSLLLNGRGGLFIFAVELGGVLAAALFSVVEKRGVDLHSWAAPLAGERRRSRTRRTNPRPTPSVPWRRETADVETPARGNAPGARARATQAEVDRILDKISAQGKASLTDEERRILDEYSRR